MLSLIRSAAAGSHGIVVALGRQSRLMSSSRYVEEEDYVYLPPGSSIKDPFTISGNQRVFYTDPVPDEQEVHAHQVQAAGKQPHPSVKEDEDSGPHPYRMVDEYSQQTYVYSASRHSMREPRYVSISDPVYMQDPHHDHK